MRTVIWNSEIKKINEHIMTWLSNRILNMKYLKNKLGNVKDRDFRWFVQNPLTDPEKALSIALNSFL